VITLKQAKEYLRVDFKDDDVFIKKLIQASKKYIQNTGADYKNNELVDIAGLLLIQHWYYNRTIMGRVPKNVAHGIDAILFQERYKEQGDPDASG